MLLYFTFYFTFWDVIGYREYGTPAPSLNIFENKLIDTRLSRLLPLSRECPEGAICHGKSIVSCTNPDYVVKQSIFASFVTKMGTYVGFREGDLSFLLPFGKVLLEPFCVRDTAKLQREARKQEQLFAMLNQLEDVVRRWMGRGNYYSMIIQFLNFNLFINGEKKNIGICGEEDNIKIVETTAEEWNIARATPKSKEIIGMPFPVAKRALHSIVGPRWSSERFEELWDLTLQYLLNPEKAFPSEDPLSTTHSTTFNDPKGQHHHRATLYTTLDQSGRHRLIRSQKGPIFSFACSLKQNLWQQAKSHWVEFFVTGVLIMGATLIHLRMRLAARDAVVVSSLVEDILDSLHIEAENHRVDPVRHPVSGLSVAQLRDHFLIVAVSSTNNSSSSHDSLNTSSSSSSSSEMAVPIQDAQGRTRWTVPDEAAKNRLFKKASALILKNASVRETMMEFRGDHHTVWQWIGSHALSPRKKPVAYSQGPHHLVPGAIAVSENSVNQYDSMKNENSMGAFEATISSQGHEQPTYPTI